MLQEDICVGPWEQLGVAEIRKKGLERGTYGFLGALGICRERTGKISWGRIMNSLESKGVLTLWGKSFLSRRVMQSQLYFRKMNMAALQWAGMKRGSTYGLGWETLVRWCCHASGVMKSLDKRVVVVRIH